MPAPNDGGPDRDPSDDSWIDWHALERAIPLDELPAFHRAFLEEVEPGERWREAPLRRVQGKVQAALKRLERQGLARRDALGERLWLARRLLPPGWADRAGAAGGGARDGRDGDDD